MREARKRGRDLLATRDATTGPVSVAVWWAPPFLAQRVGKGPGVTRLLLEMVLLREERILG